MKRALILMERALILGKLKIFLKLFYETRSNFNGTRFNLILGKLKIFLKLF
jgi:hypothetical protein